MNKRKRTQYNTQKTRANRQWNKSGILTDLIDRTKKITRIEFSGRKADMDDFEAEKVYLILNRGRRKCRQWLDWVTVLVGLRTSIGSSHSLQLYLYASAPFSDTANLIGWKSSRFHPSSAFIWSISTFHITTISYVGQSNLAKDDIADTYERNLVDIFCCICQVAGSVAKLVLRGAFETPFGRKGKS